MGKSALFPSVSRPEQAEHPVAKEQGAEAKRRWSSGLRAHTFALSVAVYTAAFAVLAWPWLSGVVTIPWDAKAQFQPELQFLASSLAHGDSPFWTPNVFAGWPQIADPQSLIFSPLHFALAALDPAPSFREADFITFAYLFAGGLGLMVFFRDRGWHPGGAVIAALIFAFGGSAASRLQHTSEIISLSYVPIALWLLARTLDRASWRVGVLAGVVVALLMIGRDQVALLGLYVLALYVVAWWLDSEGRLARIRRTVLPLVVCATTAVLIAAVPLTLSALLAADSNRPMIGLERAGRGSLHPVLLLMLAFADLFGAADPNVDFWGPPSIAWDATMPPSGLALAQNMGEIYCGILSVILILGAGILRGLAWARDIRFFTLALVLVLLYALGWYTPTFRLVYEVLPGVDLFRRPADATFIIGLLIAIEAGYLVHRVVSGTAPQPRWFYAVDVAIVGLLVAIAIGLAHKAGKLDVSVLPVATGIVFAAAAIALLGLTRRLAPARPVLACALLVGFTTFDLAWNNAPNESTGLPPARYDALRPQTRNETVALIKAKLAETSGPDRRDRVELIGIAYHWPNLALAQDFDHLFGHNPLRLRDFTLATGVGDTVAEARQRPFAPLFPSYRSTMANLCGVRFIATGVPVEEIDTSLHPGDLKLIAHTEDAYVYENPQALPRVMVVPDYQLADFGDLIRDGWPDVDPRRTVLLEQPPPAPPRAADSEAVPGSARILRYANTEIDIEVEAPDGGFLVLNDAWHPWWRAEVDGQPADILKANVIFRAVQVGVGMHRVHFVFEPLQGAWDELKEKVATVAEVK
ncbi:MAG TPA: hypothetical protein VKP67_07545 [Xanthobacteraceae bacterium]|nr:hypothetical protein [Xanthobacteraceae bacterium]